MALASGVSFHLDSGSFPVAYPARADACVRWGDDYQLLFTAPLDAALPVPATQIGLVDTRGFEPLWIDGRAPEGDWLGYQHD
jgi:thiamine-monophosphate kinase